MARSHATVSVADTFPALHSTAIVQKHDGTNASRVYDIKFYNFPTSDAERIFAVCTIDDIFVCRLAPEKNPPFEVLRWWKDENTSSEYNSIAWTVDPVRAKPWLCIAGASPKQIHILDIESGEKVRTLSGHGKGINALAVSPLSSDLLFSASEDYTVRVWNLSPAYSKQPCVGLFAGEGHRQPILAMDIHPSGRWMLSGGLDTAVCMWLIPTVDELDRPTTPSQKHPDPKLIFHPVFYSTDVHYNYVDNVIFYGDLILSRACQEPDTKENEILLWKIDGFDSTAPPPDHPPESSPGVYTRSAFPHAASSRGFQRLLTFDMPWTDRFYQRMSLFQAPNCRPLLAMGNQRSKMLFWDLQTLEEGSGPGEDGSRKKRGRKPKSAGRGGGVHIDGLNRLAQLHREQSIASGSVDGTQILEDATDAPSTTTPGSVDRKWMLNDPYNQLPPHRTTNIDTTLLKNHFGTTAIAFSPDGLWMISVGDHGVIAFFRRDRTQTV